MHDSLWLRAKELLKEGCMSIETFDNMTYKRIDSILKLREKQLEEQQKYMEEQRKQQEREMARKSIMKK